MKSFDNLREEQLSSEYFYKGKIINMRRDKALLPDGSEAFREVVEHPGGVCVAALTDEREVLFVRQFRYPYFEEVLEIPAGKRDPGEEPLDCGKRELKEETGAEASEWICLGELYPTAAYSDECIIMYLAKGLTFGDRHLDDDEFISVEAIPLGTVVNDILAGKISDAKTQAAVLRAYLMTKE